ncbi:MAG: hypothetical protein ABIO69_08490 [Sphingomicrobium sp.]
MRFGIAAMAVALALAPVAGPALAQEAPPATTAPAETPPPATPPPAETIGPRELQNFSLNGTVTRPAPQVPATTTAPAVTSTGTESPRPGAAPTEPTASRPTRGPSPAGSSVTVALPPAGSLSALPTPAPTVGGAAQPSFQPAPSATTPVATPAGPGRGSLIPWLLAIALLVGAAVYFFWRQRSQPGYAPAGAGYARVAPERAPAQPLRPAPQPAARPTPRPTSQPTPQPTLRPAPQPVARTGPVADPVPQPLQRTTGPEQTAHAQLPTGFVSTRLQPAPQAPSGVVSTRLRPWLEIEFTPGRCVIEEDKATIQFDVSVFNSGSAPARDVLIEASMFNAGPAQDQEIGAFFSNPVAKGDRIPAIAPLKRVALKSAVSLTLDQMRQFEVAGKRIFVPLIGFNALYRWSGGDGQTSASYLVGRDTNTEKMAPLRLDLGPRIFRGLGAREHNIGVRV